MRRSLKLINHLNTLLSDEAMRMELIKTELIEMRDKFGDKRRTEIVHSAEEFNVEDLIADEEVVVTLSHMGYIKRTALSEYKSQGRGGVGNKGVSHRGEDFVEHMFVATNHNYLLFFTDHGRCFWMKVWEVPEGAKTTKGRAIQNLISIPPEDKIRACINVINLKDETYANSNYIVMVTKQGIIKKTTLEAYSRPRANGINAITIREGDELLDVKLTNGSCEVIIAKKSGKAIRFAEEKVRPMGRTASGVKAVKLENDKDEVVGMVCVEKGSPSTILVVSERGYGKRTDLEDYRITGRGGKGVKTLSITDKTGVLVAILNVNDEMDLMIINKSGLTIRIPVMALRVMGRATQGVRLIKMRENDEIASIAGVDKEEEEQEVIINESGEIVLTENSNAENTPESITDELPEDKAEGEDNKEVED
jgi:DNA gyrase subunit A